MSNCHRSRESEDLHSIVVRNNDHNNETINKFAKKIIKDKKIKEKITSCYKITPTNASWSQILSLSRRCGTFGSVAWKI